MTTKRKHNVKGKIECPDCGRKLMNAGALRGHKAFCKGPPGDAGGASETPTRRPSAKSTEDERSRPSHPRTDAWGPLGDL